MRIDSPSFGVPAAPPVLAIGELVRRVASLLERSFPLSWVAGEVSNLTKAASGHWYFSMKDRDAQVRCVMFRNRNQSLDWIPREGDRVEARVLPGLYAPRGDFQLQVEQLRRAGAGALYEAFLRIKGALDAEGLFAPARKRPLPAHPRVIGVVTSLQAAALRDVLSTLARRSPHVEVIVFPTPVQGSEAPQRIVEAVAAAAHHDAPHPIDVLLLVRGGGSIEDLWAFNDERVARAIAATRVPVVTGIGHETDFTIADFVADVRAPTPTAAAELASPDASALAVLLVRRTAALRRALERRHNALGQRIDEASRRLRSPAQRLSVALDRVDAVQRRLRRAGLEATAAAERRVALAKLRLGVARPDPHQLAGATSALRDRMTRAVAERLRTSSAALLGARQQLVLLDPRGILQRGYAIVTDKRGRAVLDPRQVPHGRAAADRSGPRPTARRGDRRGARLSAARPVRPKAAARRRLGR